MSARARAAGAALALLCGCSSEPASLGVVARLAERTVHGLSTASVARAAIGGQTRAVLADWPTELLLYREPARTDADAGIAREVPLGSAFPDARRVVLVARARRPRKPWQVVGPLVAPVAGAGDARTLALAARFDEIGPDADVELNVRAWVEPPRTDVHESAPFAVPAQAALEFAFGALDASGARARVRFAVEICDPVPEQADAPCEPLFEAALDVAADRGWTERSVPLDAWAGRQAWLRFTSRLEGPEPAYPVWGSPALVAPAALPDAPNILLVSIDTLRADHLSPYGYARDTSPFLASLAERSVLFESLVSAATTTAPSHMTMFTSLPPSAHGIRLGQEEHVRRVVTLAERLRATGYETAAFTENGPLAARRGFALGFDVYSENKSAGPHPDGHLERTFAQARAWIDAHRARRFFVFLHTFQVHAPYTPPPEYQHLFVEPLGGRGSRAEREMARYDREIRYVDDQLRALFVWLEERGLAENTLVVLTSDHGEAFEEHGAMGHGAPPHEEIARVPLIVHGPGVGAGRRVASPVAHVDLMPTLLEIAGAPAAAPAVGRSFAPLLYDAAAQAAERPAVTEAWTLPDTSPGPVFAVRLGSRKLLRHPDRFEYYDLAADPGERHDHWPAHAHETEDLRAALDAHDHVAAELAETLGDAPRSTPLDPEQEEKLRMLGYIE